MSTEEAMAVVRAAQARRLEAKCVDLVRKYGLLLKMNPAVREVFAELAAFNDFQQLQKEL